MTEDTVTRVRAGGCMCGAVRYRVAGPLRPIVLCHCAQCRRMTGHVMAATAAMRRDFTLDSSAEIAWYAASEQAKRGFCARCGSTLFWDGAGLDYISIAAGTLDESDGLTIACQIFVAEKGGYYEIDDKIPAIDDGNFKVDCPA